MRERRARMVADQIERRGIRDPRVLKAMATVPRGMFVQEADESRAYVDAPLPIGFGQTISQPYIVAFMVEALCLKGGEKVLEVGAGSGYAAAVVAQIAQQVFALERVPELAERASRNLRSAGIDNVRVACRDGSLGWPEHAPFDAILVSAGAKDVPQPLLHQLRIGGTLVIPVGTDLESQHLLSVRRTGDDAFSETRLADVRFVPLIECGELDESRTSRNKS